MAVGLAGGEVDEALERSTAVAGEVVVLRAVGAEGGEATVAMGRGVEDEVGGVFAVQQAGQGVAVLPGVDRQDLAGVSGGPEHGVVHEQVGRVPVLAAAAVGDDE